MTGLAADKANLIKQSLKLDSWGDEEIVKFTRQLQFAIAKGEIDSFLKSFTSSRSDEGSRVMVPKTRFGKTNLQISVLTCGGMRLQETWCPDNLPLLGSRSPVVGFGMSAIKTSCQNNLVATIRRALAIGINHFETARYYGTSEMQFADALDSMIKSGELKRSDFILQTKIPPCQKLSELKKQWDASWSLFSKLGHIDLLSSHGLSTDKTYGYFFDNGEDSNLPFMQQLVQEGKVHHLGVATHGTPALVAKLINSGAFSYINLHSHGVFGSYHGSGIADGAGDYGHRANVALAKSLDMGVFVISPFDKGGKLYEPSSTLKELMGSELTAIEFQALYQWGALGGVDTIVVGASKPSDFDEAFGVVQRFRMDDPATIKVSASALSDSSLSSGPVGSVCQPCQSVSSACQPVSLSGCHPVNQTVF
jgi:predicted aldo/keto reductase-like oxidoreductase